METLVGVPASDMTDWGGGAPASDHSRLKVSNMKTCRGEVGVQILSRVVVVRLR